MHFTIVTLFPEFFQGPLSCGLLARAKEKELVSFSLVNPRDFALDAHRSVDDRPYGGGPGMVMALEPLLPSLDSIPEPGAMLLMSPSGEVLDHGLAQALGRERNITLICGRYEGVDARLARLRPVREVSVGDFVLNGGEAAALCVIEAVARLTPGFMGHEDSAGEESFAEGLLEYPQYTRPESYGGLDVPEVLTSGDHQRIAAWRREQSLTATLAKRPDLLDSAPLTRGDMKFLAAQASESGRLRLGRNLFLALLHHPVLNKQGRVAAVSLTNLDLHDIARCSLAYGLGGFFVATPLDDQRRLMETLRGHWVEGPGQETNPDRAKALSKVAMARDLDEIVARLTERAGRPPRLVATSARKKGVLAVRQVREWLETDPVLLVLGTASGLADEVLERMEGCLRPLRFLDRDNHLSVRTAAAVTLDRLLGDAY